MIEMPPRNKTHWDYLLEEMRWMAIDFRQERTFKRQAAKKVVIFSDWIFHYLYFSKTCILNVGLK